MNFRLDENYVQRLSIACSGFEDKKLSVYQLAKSSIWILNFESKTQIEDLADYLRAKHKQ